MGPACPLVAGRPQAAQHMGCHAHLLVFFPFTHMEYIGLTCAIGQTGELVDAFPVVCLVPSSTFPSPYNANPVAQTGKIPKAHVDQQRHESPERNPPSPPKCVTRNGRFAISHPRRRNATHIRVNTSKRPLPGHALCRNRKIQSAGDRL